MMKTYNVAEAIKAQKDYCKEKNFPHFAPHNGVCYSCQENIYKEIKHNVYDVLILVRTYTTGISVEQAGSHITGCPHCSRSYCD